MKLRIAIVGCGHIRTQYGQHIQNYPDLLEIVGATDLDLQRAHDFCNEFGGKVYRDFEEVLADPGVDVIVNLTVHHVHFELNRRALLAGKHVLSEKPMALNHADAQELCRLACQVDRRLVSAPTTFLSEAMQTTARLLKEDLLGPLRLVYAEVNWAQIERWISNPAPYFTVGPLLDVGVYAITGLVYLLGPVRQVWGYSTILKNPRADKHGNAFPVTAPDFTTGMMEFESGVVARITTNYYVNAKPLPHLRGFEFHGDDASLTVSNYHDFGAELSLIPYGQEAVPVPMLREPEARMDRAIGLADLALALRDNRPHRSSAEQAAHVIEVMEGLQASADHGGKVAIHSSFTRPEMMDWAAAAPLSLPEGWPLARA
ncbi:MAG TPA: Gfo/Idh/MocA family oxidoreductase [Chthoniobacteraceae bacterium]|nr:Gfo/Idh/MocA family oxidoreductase [Chthoniobacteraceae bacterium]